ncbi:MAG: ThuA domain-containing protein [Gemmataceae bacterium]|nr:ThuA domain-containing protein [Gemmataceae bacterium]
MTRLLLATLTACLCAGPSFAADPIKVLIVDGQNNHSWKTTTPIMKSILEDTKLFKVEVATSPAKAGGAPQKPKDPNNAAAQKTYEEALAKFKDQDAKYKQEMAAFRPKFSNYQVVVSNYNGDQWPKETQADFVEFVSKGGGFVPVHAANNSFPEWAEYNSMIGVGGWGGRNEKSGPYVRLREGKFVLDTSKGSGGGHGRQHEFLVEVRKTDHPITKGLPTKWLHTADELYDKLRGPAQNLTVLATAFADTKTGGSGEHEPMLIVVEYEKGRVFHTTLGHADVAMKCVGFRTTFARGCEWAATGTVTQQVPTDFPGPEKASAKP